MPYEQKETQLKRTENIPELLSSSPQTSDGTSWAGHDGGCMYVVVPLLVVVVERLLVLPLAPRTAGENL